MIQADELTAVILPQGWLDQGVLLLVPLAEVVIDQTAGIAGIFVEAPERMVDAVFDHEVPQISHPRLILSAVHKSAPLAHEQRCHFLIL